MLFCDTQMTSTLARDNNVKGIGGTRIFTDKLSNDRFFTFQEISIVCSLLIRLQHIII
jgi:hypothetical protein